MKLYSVVYGPEPLDWPSFAPGLEMTEAALPSPDVEAGRLGLGFLIAHQGRTGNYAVLGYWDRENELPIRIFVSPDGRPGTWRPNRGDESFCVWDLEIMWAEREAYVTTVLAPAGCDPEAYLALSYGVPV